MTSNLGRHAPRNLERELVLAYGGEVPPPYYLQAAVGPIRVGAHHHPGELEVALPYAAMPSRFLLASAVSLDELEEALERRARREES